MRKHSASARSSTYRNSRRGTPEPHTVTSAFPACFAVWNLRRSAGSTCEVLRSKLSPGPYRLVGITEIALKPYWRAYAWHILMPAILATAYHWFVGSSGPVSSDDSFSGCGASRG